MRSIICLYTVDFIVVTKSGIATAWMWETRNTYILVGKPHGRDHVRCLIYIQG